MGNRIEIDLTKKGSLFELTRLHSEECAPLYKLEAEIRDRLDAEGKPITKEEAILYDRLLKRMNRNSGILSRLIEQAIKLQKIK